MEGFPAFVIFYLKNGIELLFIRSQALILEIFEFALPRVGEVEFRTVEVQDGSS